MLERFHYNLLLPWAWAIVATTIVVRILLVPLTVRQIHSMQAMQAHAPEMKEIQRKYKGDRQKLNEELMKFYKENNINPAASCLPLLAQFPVFISLYLVLRHFSKHVPCSLTPRALRRAGRLRVAARRPEHRGQGELALVGLPAARDLRGQPGALDLLHVRDDGQDAADDHDDRPADLHHRHRALPGRPRPLLGDDEPVDGRPGPRHAAADAEDAGAELAEGARREPRPRQPAAAARARTAGRQAGHEAAPTQPRR